MKNTHNDRVKKEVQKLKKTGWKVKAHLPKQERPEPIGKNGFIPDIHAKKGTKEKIIEVDTPRSVNKKQLEAFKKSAAHIRNRNFEQIITKPRKK